MELESGRSLGKKTHFVRVYLEGRCLLPPGCVGLSCTVSWWFSVRSVAGLPGDMDRLTLEHPVALVPLYTGALRLMLGV